MLHVGDMQVLAGSPGRGEEMVYGDAGWPQSLPDVHASSDGIRLHGQLWWAAPALYPRRGEEGGGGTASLKVGTHCQTTTPAFWPCPPLSFL